MYAQNLGQAGIGVYLVRAAAEVDDRTWNVAATLLLAIAVLLVGVLECSLGLIEAWIPLPDLGPLLSVLLLSLIPQILGVAAGARLERALDFRRVAMIEVAAQLIYYAVALPLVWFGFSVWSLVAAWSLQQVFCLRRAVCRGLLPAALAMGCGDRRQHAALHRSVSPPPTGRGNCAA